MADKLLDVNDLTVSVEEKEILHDINLSINKGETHVLMGPNGAGKSTLGFALMGSPKYTLNSGDILFNGKNINDETPDKRSKDGIFLSFQRPLEVPGLSHRGDRTLVSGARSLPSAATEGRAPRRGRGRGRLAPGRTERAAWLRSVSSCTRTSWKIWTKSPGSISRP